MAYIQLYTRPLWSFKSLQLPYRVPWLNELSAANTQRSYNQPRSHHILTCDRATVLPLVLPLPISRTVCSAVSWPVSSKCGHTRHQGTQRGPLSLLCHPCPPSTSQWNPGADRGPPFLGLLKAPSGKKPHCFDNFRVWSEVPMGQQYSNEPFHWHPSQSWAFHPFHDKTQIPSVTWCSEDPYQSSRCLKCASNCPWVLLPVPRP